MLGRTKAKILQITFQTTMSIKKEIKFLASLFIIFLLLRVPAKAQGIIEDEATPLATIEPAVTLLLTGISFKNKNADWVELYYESPTGKTVNLKGISFADDKVFKIIETDYWINSKSYIKLFFKLEARDEIGSLFTNYKGLTATTEQLILYDKNKKIIDAVCWVNEKPTDKEKKEMEFLVKNGGWNSADITSCFPSTTVPINEPIVRREFRDTNSKEDWSVAPSSEPIFKEEKNSPLAGNKMVTAREKIKKEKRSSSPLYSNKKTFKSSSLKEFTLKQKNSKKLQYKKQSTKEIEKSKTMSNKTRKEEAKSKKRTTKKRSRISHHHTNYANGNLSDTIFLNEVLPNPDKKRQQTEWIELFNTGEKKVNLGNWQLDDSEGGSKPYIIPDSINLKPGETIVFQGTESKINLNNEKDSIRLYDYNNKLIDEINYQETEKGKSYARIKIVTEKGSSGEEYVWRWIKNTTINKLNPVFIQLQGEIIQEAEFSNEYSFQLKTASGKNYSIFFNEEIIPGPLAKITFMSGTTVKLLVKKTENGKLELESYETVGEKRQNVVLGNWETFIPPFLISGSGIGYYLLKKKIFTKLFNKLPFF